ncbi:MAG: thiamine-phosphate kinase [Planctomycetaceae bacterium]
MEQSFLAWLRGRTRSLPSVAVGIGDDAAVVDLPPNHQLVATTDAIIEGVDFLQSEHSLRDIGYKAIAVNLSDIAAMGAVPTTILVTLALPSSNATSVAAGLYEGILECASQYGLSVAGGDISVYEGPLSISVTLLGTVKTGQAWLRSGAQEGDAIVITGPVGGSLLGRHLRPVPRIELAVRLRELATIHAAMDISDGLSLDLDRLCAASGVGAELDLSAIPIHDDAVTRSHSRGGLPAIEHALGDGEDFELILAMEAEQYDALVKAHPELGLYRIGTFVGRTGLWSRTANEMKRLSPSGFVHGQRRSRAPEQKDQPE